MLSDIDSPQSQAIFKASGLEDAILTRAKKMTLLPAEQREKLLNECEEKLIELEKICNESFNGNKNILGAINIYRDGLKKIATTKAKLDLTSGVGNCEVCGNKITSHTDYPDMIYCQQCLNYISEARRRLESPEGFGFCFI